MNSLFNPYQSFFYRKIINKYTKGRLNNFNFPILIFKKNSENVINKIIDLDFMFGFHISTFPLIVKKFQSMKKVLSLLNDVKSIPDSNAKAHHSRLANVMRNNLMTMPLKILRTFHNTSQKNSSQIHFLTQINKKKFLINSDAETRKVKSDFSYQNVINNVSYENIKAPQTLNYRNYLNLFPQTIINYSAFTNKNIPEHFPLNKPLWRNPLSNDNGVLKLQGFQNNKIFRYHEITGLSLMKFTMNVPRFESSAGMKKKYSFKKNTENLFYQNKQQIEQEIEYIKKIMKETKESVKSIALHPSGQGDFKLKVDIDRISDLVYQNIERSIRMERERRGM